MRSAPVFFERTTRRIGATGLVPVSDLVELIAPERRSAALGNGRTVRNII